MQFNETDEKRVADVDGQADDRGRPTLDDALERKSFFQAALPVFACGAGLFSDGYINNVSCARKPQAAS